jgi:hypothetical protein
MTMKIWNSCPGTLDEADILLQRVGVGAGTIKYDFDQFAPEGRSGGKAAKHSPESHFCLKCSQDAEAILQTINWNSVKHNTAGNPSISKSDVIRSYIERKHELQYMCPDFYVVERASVTYLVRNCISTAIDAPDFQTDDQRLSLVINGILHEFPDRSEFDSFCSHFQDYLDVADGGSRRRG